MLTENDIEKALETAREIMEDETATDTDRLTAAKLILTHAKNQPPPKRKSELQIALERLESMDT